MQNQSFSDVFEIICYFRQPYEKNVKVFKSNNPEVQYYYMHYKFYCSVFMQKLRAVISILMKWLIYVDRRFKGILWRNEVPKLMLSVITVNALDWTQIVLSDTLSVSSQGASISANEVWGALRGLETFSQLIQQDETGQVSASNSTLYIKK